MFKSLLSFLILGVFTFTVNAQGGLFDEELQIPPGYAPTEVLLPPSPLTMQVLFIGGVDLVQTTPTYGNPAGQQFAKEWHDFIGVTPDDSDESLCWVTVNHEQIYRDDRIGDGGGMTAFRLDRDPITGQLEVIDQALTDGRKGKFFNVDFVNTVGETGMNCGGIVSYVDGRIWTAEEWFRSGNSSINNGSFGGTNPASWNPHAPGNSPNQGVRDTADYTISSDIPGFDGLTVQKFQNFNWMVEVDPREAKAIRKQYNWGRQGFEGGAILSDNQTVILGEDGTPGWVTKFVADTPGDFTKGKTYVYKHDDPNKWVELNNADTDAMLEYKSTAVGVGATMFNRIEWVVYDGASGKVYLAETGRDNPGSRWSDEADQGAVFAPHHNTRALDQGVGTPRSGDYWDYYGRVLVWDPATDEITVHLEAGPYFAVSPSEADYPNKHLTNPDGLSVMTIDDRSFLVICEDLNGTSFGRTPEGVSNRLCELYLLDLTIEEPTVDDLVKVTATPVGAEVTGAWPTPDGKSLLVNSQHPSGANPFPFNHSLTFAINGFDRVNAEFVNTDEEQLIEGDLWEVFPNPTTRLVRMNRTLDVAVYDVNGRRLNVYRNTNEIDVSALPAGAYFLQAESGEIKKLIVQ